MQPPGHQAEFLSDMGLNLEESQRLEPARALGERPKVSGTGDYVLSGAPGSALPSCIA